MPWFSLSESLQIARERAVPETIQFSDDDVIRRIADEQKRRGDSSPTRTAIKLLIERLTQLEIERRTAAPEPSASRA